MISSKISGIFKKFLRQPDDQPLLHSTNSLQNCNENVLTDSNCAVESQYSGNLNHSAISQGVAYMGGDSKLLGACNGTACQKLGGPECPSCLALLSSESAACPIDSSTTTTLSSSSVAGRQDLSYLSSSAEPLCCCESCSWWTDSYPHLTLPNTELNSTESDVENHLPLKSPVISTSARQAFGGRESKRAVKQQKTCHRPTSSYQVTSIPNDSTLHYIAGRSPTPNDDDFPVTVTTSYDGEEGYAAAQQRLLCSNLLRHNATSLNFEAERCSMKAPPNKSICHVVR